MTWLNGSLTVGLTLKVLRNYVLKPPTKSPAYAPPLQTHRLLGSRRGWRLRRSVLASPNVRHVVAKGGRFTITMSTIAKRALGVALYPILTKAPSHPQTPPLRLLGCCWAYGRMTPHSMLRSMLVPPVTTVGIKCRMRWTGRWQPFPQPFAP